MYKVTQNDRKRQMKVDGIVLPIYEKKQRLSIKGNDFCILFSLSLPLLFNEDMTMTNSENTGFCCIIEFLHKMYLLITITRNRQLLTLLEYHRCVVL